MATVEEFVAKEIEGLQKKLEGVRRPPCIETRKYHRYEWEPNAAHELVCKHCKWQWHPIRQLSGPVELEIRDRVKQLQSLQKGG